MLGTGLKAVTTGIMTCAAVVMLTAATPQTRYAPTAKVAPFTCNTGCSTVPEWTCYIWNGMWVAYLNCKPNAEEQRAKECIVAVGPGEAIPSEILNQVKPSTSPTPAKK